MTLSLSSRDRLWIFTWQIERQDALLQTAGFEGQGSVHHLTNGCVTVTQSSVFPSTSSSLTQVYTTHKQTLLSFALLSPSFLALQQGSVDFVNFVTLASEMDRQLPFPLILYQASV